MAGEPNIGDDEGLCTAIMRIFEGEWAVIEDHGPPEMATVLKHVIAPRRRFSRAFEEPALARPPISKIKFKRQPRIGADAEIKRQFTMMQKDTKVGIFFSKYRNLLTLLSIKTY